MENARVPFGISFLVIKGSGISFLELKKQPPEMSCKRRCSKKFQGKSGIVLGESGLVG